MPIDTTPAAARHAMVIGASRGIGLGLVRTLLGRGWQVSATVRDLERMPAALSELQLQHPRQLDVVAFDMAQAAPASNLVKPAQPLQLLVVSAGVLGPEHQRADQVTRDELADLFNINAMAPLRVARALLPALSAGGVVAFISSRMGSVALNDGEGLELYRASKAALNSLTRGFAIKEAIPAGLGVLNLHPGWVQSDMGGSNAPVTVEKSTSGMVTVIEAALGQIEHRFLDFEGNTLDW